MGKRENGVEQSRETKSLLDLYKLFLTYHKVIPEDNDKKAWNRGYIGGIIRAWYTIDEKVRDRITKLYDLENPDQ